MTIDEEIRFRKHNIELAKQISDEEMRCQEAQRLEWINELKWYREQDLIQREDVIELLEQHILLDDDFDEEQARFIAENEYRRVPKAEPPTSSKMEQVRNGDCETCNNIASALCPICSGGKDNYYERAECPIELRRENNQ